MERNCEKEITEFMEKLELEMFKILGTEEIEEEEEESTKEIVINQLKEEVEKIRCKASLEDALFSFDKEENIFIKDSIKSYMMWFKFIACRIEKTIKIIEENME